MSQPSKQDTPNLDLQLPNKFQLPQLQLRTQETQDHVDDLMQVRNVRATLFNAITHNGLINDPEMIEMVMNILKDMDNSTLKQMRIKVDEKAAQSNEEHARAIAAAALAVLSENKVRQPAQEILEGTEIPELPDDIVTRDFVQGEHTQGTVHQTFEDFQAKMGEIELAKEDAPDDE